MRILIICSGKPSNPQWSFVLNRSYVYEQAESLKEIGVEYETYFIEGKGILGYLKNYKKMTQKIKDYQPNVIHAHYGLSGLLATLQRKVPVITTFHGSDINIPFIRIFSYIASRLSAENIFVNKEQPAKLFYKKEVHLIPCGIDTKAFSPIDKIKAQIKLKLDLNKKYALFTGSFTNKVKNYPLAKDVIEKTKYDIELLELKGYTREEVCFLLNAVDVLIMTSFTEGSPMIIKEAMCCNCPVVSVNVGDVKDTLFSTKGSYVSSSYESIELEKYIENVITVNKRTNAREKALQYDLKKVAKEVWQIYKKVMM